MFGPALSKSSFGSDDALDESAKLTWCPRRDSNPEPTDYESAALTVELQGHMSVNKA